MSEKLNTENAPAAEKMQTGLTYNDLVVARNALHLASKRGAFTDPREYKELGEVFLKLDAFINAVQAQQQPEVAAPAEAAQE